MSGVEGYFFRWVEDEKLGDTFLLKERLGRGTYGVVGRAIRLKDGQNRKRGDEVALKIPFDQEIGEENLKREPDILQQFNHENIVKVFGYHTVAGLFVIEMELVKGNSLADVLDNQRIKNAHTLLTMMDWVIQVACALRSMGQYAHGDIKPQNILIREDGVVKLVDFGTSRRLEDVWVFTRGQGTEQYMAPEVALDNKRVSMKSDLYSLGVILYEVATGDVPFHSNLERLQGKTLTKPRELNSALPIDLEKIILRCLERDPDNRYLSWDQFILDLDELRKKLLAQEEVDFVPETHRYEFRPEPTSPLYYLDRAKKALLVENFEEALRNAEEAAVASDNHPNYLRLLAAVCLRSQYYERAKDVLRQLLSKYDLGYPVESEQILYVLKKLGDLYVKTRDYQNAIKVWERLIEESDRKSVAKFKLAITLGLDGQYKRSIQLLEEVRDDYPESVLIYNKLGWAYSLAGNHRLAISYYNQALVYDAADLFSLFELGKYYLITGDRTRSQKYFDKIRKYDTTGEFTSKINELFDL